MNEVAQRSFWQGFRTRSIAYLFLLIIYGLISHFQFGTREPFSAWVAIYLLTCIFGSFGALITHRVFGWRY